jgi:hypothetical protein
VSDEVDQDDAVNARLLADETAHAGWGGLGGLWVPRLSTSTLPSEVAAVTQAVRLRSRRNLDFVARVVIVPVDAW